MRALHGTFLVLYFGLSTSYAVSDVDRHISALEPRDARIPLVNFQVQQPPALPRHSKQCTVELVHHLFGHSYYQPAILDYTPPTDCGTPGSWAGVSLNYTATSNGRQYDRLSALSLHNVEIWRTSTAEPTRTGIIWTALKDVSLYMPLFAEPGTLILDLPNIIDTTLGLNGSFDVTLSATFYQASVLHPPAKKSSVILPLSNMSPNQVNYFSVPPSFTINVSLPINAAEAYAEIYASGNSDEEFWYLNAANEFFDELPPQSTNPTGPFREVRLLVDDHLAGVAFPYPVIFTGGVLPSLWRPISAYGSFDQPTYKIDLTAFLPILADGRTHNITLDVTSAEPDHGILGNWFLSGNIQVITDPSSRPTTGSILSYSAPQYASSKTTGHVSPQPDGTNDVEITVSASHKLEILSRIVTGSGKTTLVRWSQDLSFNNWQSYTRDANYLIAKQKSFGTSLSTHNGVPVVKDKFEYPLTIYYNNIDITQDNTTGWYASVDHSYTRTDIPNPLVTGNFIATHQHGAGTWLRTNGVVTANGTTSETFRFSDFSGNTYWRDVSATNSSVTRDKQGGSLASTWTWPWSFGGSSQIPQGGHGGHEGFAGRLADQRLRKNAIVG